MKVVIQQDISMQEIQRAFTYHYNRCGIDPQITNEQWKAAQCNPSKICVYREAESGTLRAFYEIDPATQTFDDGTPITDAKAAGSS